MSRLTRLGEPTLEVISERRAIEAACEEAWRLESSGWKREAGTAITCDPAVHRFYTALVERGTAAGWLQLLFLKVGDRRIATSYGACFNDRLFLFKTGYDPEFATGAPFKILTYFAIREAYARGLTEVDFLGDAEPWKLEWTSTSRGHDWLFVFADTMRARLLHSVKFQWVPELKRWRAMTGTFVPTYQGLSAVDFVRPAVAARAACFPFNVPDRLPFYRARNAIYHLFHRAASNAIRG